MLYYEETVCVLKHNWFVSLCICSCGPCTVYDWFVSLCICSWTMYCESTAAQYPMDSEKHKLASTMVMDFWGVGHPRNTTYVEHPQGGTCHWPTLAVLHSCIVGEVIVQSYEKNCMQIKKIRIVSRIIKMRIIHKCTATDRLMNKSFLI